jgi:hypothetical protein
VANRFAGTTWNARVNHGSSAVPSAGYASDARRRLAACTLMVSAPMVSPVNGSRPVSASKTTTANDQRSLRWSSFVPMSCSGLM